MFVVAINPFRIEAMISGVSRPTGIGLRVGTLFLLHNARALDYSYCSLSHARCFFSSGAWVFLSIYTTSYWIIGAAERFHEQTRSQSHWHVQELCTGPKGKEGD